MIMYGPPGKTGIAYMSMETDQNDRKREDDQYEGDHEGVRCKGLRTSLCEVFQELEGRRRINGGRLLKGAGNGPMRAHP